MTLDRSDPVVLDDPLRDVAYVAPPGLSPRWFHRRLPRCAPTPLDDVPRLAERLGVGRVLVKDESSRLGLPAFKMLGASWASYRALCARLGREPWSRIENLAAAMASLRPLILATATDGNHGPAVARMARWLGFGGRIWVPAGAASARAEAAVGEGAEVAVSRGGYHAAVVEAAAAADDRTLVISDTSWEGYETVPLQVIEGHATILEEVEEQMAQLGLGEPDVAAVPVGVGVGVGVGAFAAAVARHARRRARIATRLVSAEPLDAACALASAREGRIVTLPGPQRSIMAGLNCGTPSAVAGPVVLRSFDTFVAVSDAQAVDAMRAMARCGIAAGESAAAPLAALAVLAARGRLGPSDTVLIFSTEGVTDPDFYARAVTAKLEPA